MPLWTHLIAKYHPLRKKGVGARMRAQGVNLVTATHDHIKIECWQFSMPLWLAAHTFWETMACWHEAGRASGRKSEMS